MDAGTPMSVIVLLLMLLCAIFVFASKALGERDDALWALSSIWDSLNADQKAACNALLSDDAYIQVVCNA